MPWSEMLPVDYYGKRRKKAAIDLSRSGEFEGY